jgi:hypothetical protein
MNNQNYKCEVCNKYYSSYQSLFNHNKKFHTKTEVNYNCRYCHNKYKHQSNRSRHEKTCILNPKLINNQDNNINKENKELKKIISNLQSVIDNNNININNNCNNTTNNTTNNNTTNNTTNNTLNNINNVYVRYDNISYDKILTKNEIFNILDKKFMALEESIKKIHFNPDKEEYQNIHITNLEGKYAFVYDGGDRLVAIDKDTMLDGLIDNHICEIDKYKDKLKDKKTVDKLEELVTSIIDNKPFIYGDKRYNNYTDFKKEGINLIIYNKTDKDKFTKLHSKERKMKLIEKETLS